jgi:superfamily II DNA or RNA helicase
MKITITISNTIVISPLFRQAAAAIKPMLTMENPQWKENNRRGYSNRGIQQYIRCYRQETNKLEIPRGFIQTLITILHDMNIEIEIIDLRRSFPPLGLKFKGELRPYQQETLKAILDNDFGVICAPTRSGKTVMALAAAAYRDQPFTVMVHTKELLDQWAGTPKKEGAIEKFLGIKPGIVAGGKFNIGQEATVALVQTLYKNPAMVAANTGFLIHDEVHRCPARMFREAVAAFDCRYVLGPSATPYRQDGLTNLIHWYVGPQVHEVDRKILEDQGAILRAVVIPRITGFMSDVELAPPWFSESYDPEKDYGSYDKIISALISDPDRNMMIARDAAGESRNGTCLVLTDRKEHVQLITEAILTLGVDCRGLTSDSKDRQVTVDYLNSGRAKVVVATGQLLGEGFDCRALTAAFLAMPLKAGKTEGGGKITRFLQYIGRVLTPAPGKELAVIYDYVDWEVPSMKRAWKSRHREYKVLGWQVRNM